MPTSSRTPLDVVLASGNLPSPSGVALQILELTRDKSATAEDMQRVLATDPALAGQLLRYANSAQARTGSDARTIGEAVVRLGMTNVRQLALGFSLLSGARTGPCEGFDYNGYWSRSLATGVAAQCLAPLAEKTAPDEAFTCGLLGHVGSLCLASVHPREYADILQRCAGGTAADLLELEQEVLMLDHDDVTAALMDQWGLPESYAIAITAQRRIDGAERTSGLACVLAVARDIAEVCVADETRRPTLTESLLARAETLGLTSADVIQASDLALAEWSRMGEVLDIITEDIPSLAVLAERAQQEDQPSSLFSEDGEITIELPSQSLVPVDLNAPLRILVVDDSPLDVRIVSECLAKEGHQIEVATDGQDGLTTALRWNPHVIISDWMMPGLDGLELCRMLRQSDEVGDVYVMMMTSNDDNDDLVTALEAGADDYVPKPINQAVLVARLRSASRVVHLQERAARDREAIRSFAAELSIANRKLQHMALYDTLTGLPNRRYAMERLAKEWDRTHRTGEPLLCMILDIDHFKQVNDTYGHDAGDVVLQHTARAMQECLRSSDDVCRFGGEEFLAICPNADLAVAQELGDRLRAAVENNILETDQFKGGVTVSIGVAGIGPDVESIDGMLKLADEALYAAKDAGRNKVCIVDPNPVS